MEANIHQQATKKTRVNSYIYHYNVYSLCACVTFDFNWICFYGLQDQYIWILILQKKIELVNPSIEKLIWSSCRFSSLIVNFFFLIKGLECSSSRWLLWYISFSYLAFWWVDWCGSRWLVTNKEWGTGIYDKYWHQWVLECSTGESLCKVSCNYHTSCYQYVLHSWKLSYHFHMFVF